MPFSHADFKCSAQNLADSQTEHGKTEKQYNIKFTPYAVLNKKTPPLPI